jgi:hypothetical protein
MAESLSQGLNDYLQSYGSTTLGTLLRKIGTSLFAGWLHGPLAILPFADEALKVPALRNAVISGAPALASALGTAAPQATNAISQGLNQ